MTAATAPADHPFVPQHPGIEEWKQHCTHVHGGTLCGRRDHQHPTPTPRMWIGGPNAPKGHPQ